MTEATPAKVLVIDDELGPRESLRILLKLEFQVLLANSVAQGLKLLQEQQPDVVLLDIRMPDMNGIDGLTEIRKLDSDVAVLMLTGFGALETAQEAIRRGANDYLRKPFDTREIVEVIRRHVQHTRFQRRRRRAAEELHRVNQGLLEELARKDHMAQIGQKSAEFVHDLRNPLTAVLGYVELLGDELRQSKEQLGAHWDDASEFLQSIEKNLAHCRELSEMWLKLGRKDSALIKALPVGEVVREVVETARLANRGRQVEIDLQCDAGSGYILAERIQIVRALGNLVGNAIDAVPDKTGVVRIRCTCANKTVEISVQDNGVGISQENLTRIFEPYFTTKGKAGTGLGLFITRQVIEQRDGSLTVESRPGAGATFTVRLPLVAAT
jgi:signal transduction histidine kinase